MRLIPTNYYFSILYLPTTASLQLLREQAQEAQSPDSLSHSSQHPSAYSACCTHRQTLANENRIQRFSVNL